MSTPRLSNLTLSCVSKSSPTGIESHLKKTYGVYALSLFLDVSYFHLPLLQAPYNEHSKPANYLNNPEIIARYNQIFQIPSDLKHPNPGEIIHTVLTADLARIFHTHLLWKPGKLRCVKEISPFTASEALPFKIAMHVRHQDLLEPSFTLLP